MNFSSLETFKQTSDDYLTKIKDNANHWENVSTSAYFPVCKSMYIYVQHFCYTCTYTNIHVVVYLLFTHICKCMQIHTYNRNTYI